MSTEYKRPESVLLIVHACGGQVLLLNRMSPQGFWQSVTGSLEWGESQTSAARRELQEETGISVGRVKKVPCSLGATDYSVQANTLWHHPEINCFPITSPWRPKYDPEIDYNFEHVFSIYFDLVPIILLSRKEHSEYQWFTKNLAVKKASSYTNKKAIHDIVPDPV